MSVTYGFFNAVDSDRTYNADQMSEYFDGLVSNGVYEDIGDALQVLVVSDSMSVTVGSGRGLINCKWIKNDAAVSLDITQAHATLNRYSAVVMRLDIVNRKMEFGTIDGTPASTPTKPTLANSASAIELALAYVYVPAAATALTQANVEDARGTSVCPWVTGLIQQVDTSQLFLQYQTAFQEYYLAMTQQFNEWFSTLTEELNVNTFVRKYYKREVLVSGSSTTIDLDMVGYTYDATDVINVYINGLMGAKDVDWTLDADNMQITVLTSTTGTEVQIQILKSKIGFEVLVDQDGDGIVTENDINIGI